MLKRKKLRIFLAISISEKLQQEILQWEESYKGLPVRWLKGKNLHITLLPPWYVTEKEIEKIKNILDNVGKQIRPFEMIFEKITFGPLQKQPRLIWAEGKIPSELLKLKDKLEKTLWQRGEKRKFLLHLTLARFHPEDFSSFPTKNLNEKINWQEKSQNFVLMKSHLSRTGADYEVLHKIKLNN